MNGTECTSTVAYSPQYCVMLLPAVSGTGSYSQQYCVLLLPVVAGTGSVPPRAEERLPAAAPPPIHHAHALGPLWARPPTCAHAPQPPLSSIGIHFRHAHQQHRHQ